MNSNESKEDHKIMEMMMEQLRFNQTQLKNVTKLNLQQKQMSYIPVFVFQMLQLKTIDVYNNNICKLPQQIKKLTQLNQLNIGKNRILQFPICILSLTSLKCLKLYQAQLSKLPQHLHRLCNLQELNVGGNYLYQLPISLSKLCKLKTLILTNNHIRKLPEQLCTSRVTQLILFKNSLDCLPQTFCNLSQLQILNLYLGSKSFIVLQRIPFQNLKNLNQLYLQCYNPRYKEEEMNKFVQICKSMKELNTLYINDKEVKIRVKPNLVIKEEIDYSMW